MGSHLLLLTWLAVQWRHIDRLLHGLRLLLTWRALSFLEWATRILHNLRGDSPLGSRGAMGWLVSSALSLLGRLESDLLSQLLKLVKVFLQEELTRQYLGEKNVELASQLLPLSIILAIDELLDLTAQAVERTACLPGLN